MNPGIIIRLQFSPVSQAWGTVSDLIDSFFIYLPYLFIGVIVFLLFIVASRLGKRAILELGYRTQLDLTLARVLSSLTMFGVIILGFLVASVIIFPTFKPGNLVAGLGITSVAIGFALKDILQNFFAGLLILWRKPFRIGDQVRTREFEGTVEEINVRSTFIKTYDGERVVIPNGEIYSNPVLVRTAFEYRRLIFTVGIGYLSSVDEAKGIIHRVLSQIPEVQKKPEPWVYISEFASAAVILKVYFWTYPDQANILKVTDEVASSIQKALDKSGIGTASYPHTVVLFHDETGTRPNDIDRNTYLQMTNGQPKKEA